MVSLRLGKFRRRWAITQIPSTGKLQLRFLHAISCYGCASRGFDGFRMTCLTCQFATVERIMAIIPTSKEARLEQPTVDRMKAAPPGCNLQIRLEMGAYLFGVTVKRWNCSFWPGWASQRNSRKGHELHISSHDPQFSLLVPSCQTNLKQLYNINTSS